MGPSSAHWVCVTKQGTPKSRLSSLSLLYKWSFGEYIPPFADTPLYNVEEFNDGIHSNFGILHGSDSPISPGIGMFKHLVCHLCQFTYVFKDHRPISETTGAKGHALVTWFPDFKPNSPNHRVFPVEFPQQLGRVPGNSRFQKLIC